jgi:hypothetical protein
MIRSSDKREGAQYPDDLAVAMREEGTLVAMVQASCEGKISGEVTFKK